MIKDLFRLLIRQIWIGINGPIIILWEPCISPSLSFCHSLYLYLPLYLLAPFLYPFLSAFISPLLTTFLLSLSPLQVYSLHYTLTSFLPSFLPSFLSVFLPSALPSCLPSYRFSFLPPSLPSFLNIFFCSKLRCYDALCHPAAKNLAKRENIMSKISAHANGGSCSRVCARESLRSASH
jgi:hypothetical protein